MYQKFEERKPYELLDTSKYPPEVAGRFNSFITTQFDDSLSVEMQMRSIIKWAIENFELMDKTYNDFTEYILNGNINPFIEMLNDLIGYMNEFIDTFDTKFQDEILNNLQEWYDDGTLETLINESLDTKYHEMDNRLTTQLAQTAKRTEVYLRSQGININDLDEETRQAILENNVIDIDYVLGKENVKSDNVARKAIEEKHISFIDDKGNLFAGYYINARLSGDSTSGGVLRTVENGDRSAIVPLKPNTKYHVRKEKTDRFRIGLFNSDPQIEDSVNHFVKDEFVGSDSDDYFVFQTGNDVNFAVIHTSLEGTEPELYVSEIDISEEEFKEVRIKENITSLNIGLGKNLFNGEYVDGVVFGPVDGSPSISDRNGKMAVLKIEPNTTYSISKTVSNRFRVAVSDKYPDTNTPVTRLTPDSADDQSEVTITTGETDKFLIIGVSYESDETKESTPPVFMQIEESPSVTSWETYGYKFEPMAIDYRAGSGSKESDFVRVEDFRNGTESDEEVIQKAFDSADGKVVSFDSGRSYEINTTVVAKTSLVRGIKGNNATFVVAGDIVGLRYEGSLSSTANPEGGNNKTLDITESNAFIERLRVTSKNGHEGTGVEIEKVLNANIEGCFIYNLNHGLVIKGRNRNLILSDSHLRYNYESCLLFDNVDLHQINMTGMHIAYSKKPIDVINGRIYNWQMVGCDIESDDLFNSYGDTESLINIVKTADGGSQISEVSFSGLTLQDHTGNSKPLINIDLAGTELAYFALGDSHISNSKQDQPLLYINGGKTISINNVTMKNDVALDQSIVLGDVVSDIIISNCHLPAPVVYGNTNKLIIVNNILDGFTLDDVAESGIVIANNI